MAGIPEKPGRAGRLSVKVMHGRGLLAADKNGLSDPYAMVQLGHQKVRKTKTEKKTLNPDWGETFEFECAADQVPARRPPLPQPLR